MSNNNRLQRGIVRHGTIEACRTAMEDLIDHADDLDSVGDHTLAKQIRKIAGRLDYIVASMTNIIRH